MGRVPLVSSPKQIELLEEHRKVKRLIKHLEKKHLKGKRERGRDK